MDDAQCLYNADDSGSVYDQCRRGHPEVINTITRMFPLPLDGEILDVGCGTGNETVLLQAIAGRPIWFCDKSEAMLRIATAKLGNTERAVLADFQDMRAFRDHQFAYIFTSFTYHHARDPQGFFREMFRLLRPSGRFVLFGATREQARQKPLALFFPSLRDVDDTRYLPIEDLLESFRLAGFASVRHESIHFETRRMDQDYVDRIKKRRVDSTLCLLSEAEFLQGIREIESGADPHTEFDIHRTVISGIRPLN